MAAVIQQCTWTNGKARNHLRSVQGLPMQLCALETHIRISRNPKKFVDLMRSHSSGPAPSPCPLQAQASCRRNLRKSHCGLKWLRVSTARHGDWLARLLAATLSQNFDRGSSNSQSDFSSNPCRRLCLAFLWNRRFLDVGNNLNCLSGSTRFVPPPPSAAPVVSTVAAWPHGGHLDLTADGALKWKAHRRTRRLRGSFPELAEVRLRFLPTGMS